MSPLLASPASQTIAKILTFPEAGQDGLAEIVKARAGLLDLGDLPVRFRFRPERGLAIEPSKSEVVVGYSRACEAFRAVGILLGRLASGLSVESRREACPFDSIGFMLDASRNGVPRVETVKRWIRQLALMGFNQLMLYTEDTYEIPGEPMFGYYRGRYSTEELLEIDDYAALFDIEVVPCIQTLAHLEQILQWPAYSGLKDDGGVLLAEDEKTYALVEKMLQAASAPFRSRRIHIGMDEAHGIGAGRYRFQNGSKPPFEILSHHLDVVSSMCGKMGLSPMIWSDMYFRLGSKTNLYYDLDTVISQEVSDRIPEEVDLVYWDYYHLGEDFYDEWIARHRAMGKEPVFAAGIWMWNRFWAALPHSYGTVRAGLASARRNKLRDVFVTAWGDDGMECELDSILPALQMFAEECHAGCNEDQEIHLRGSCGMEADAWLAASALDALPEFGDPIRINGNPAKWMLWHDPILNFLDRQVPPSAPQHFHNLAIRLRELNVANDPRLALAARMAEVLELKTALHLTLREAYCSGSTLTVTALCESLPRLRSAVRALWRQHRDQWQGNFKIFGWEVIELRYGGLIARLETLEFRLEAWLKDPASRIEELESPSEMAFPDGLAEQTLDHHRAVTPSWLI